MNLIDDIRKPIATEMQIFKRIFADSLRSDNPLLSSINDYVLQGSGKQLRPILTILSSKLLGNVTDATYNGALSLELLHNASLIHDDVVDDTMERRGRRSVNARWSNKVAVLSGDYMLSNALISATRTRNLDILFAVSTIGMELSDGELLQLTNTQQTKITEEDYFKVIRKKTALLFATCTVVGAYAAGASESDVQKLRSFGEYLGICFQIKDDIFDYYSDIEIGKPTANDLRDGKVTLPLIYVLKNTSGENKERCLNIIDSKDFTDEHVELIMNFAKENGGLEYATTLMNDFKNRAISELADFPDGDVKNALIQCAEFAAARKS